MQTLIEFQKKVDIVEQHLIIDDLLDLRNDIRKKPYTEINELTIDLIDDFLRTETKELWNG